jgi:hypothetical protein
MEDPMTQQARRLQARLEKLQASAQRHLSKLFPTVTVTLPTDDERHVVVISDTFEIEAEEGDEQRATIAGTRRVPTVRWFLNELVDDSDPSVGLFGSVPERLCVCDSEWHALAEAAAGLTRLEIQYALESEHADEEEEAAAQIAALCY